MTERPKGRVLSQVAKGLAFFTIIIALSGVEVATAGSSDADAEQAIESVLDQQVAAWNRGDIKGMSTAATLGQSDTPCSKDVYRQFDFWIGKWEVKSPVGKIVGRNEVTRELDGCLLVEHWKSAGSKSLGSSFNYYDIRDQLWHQLYLDNSGDAGAFPAMSGHFHDGKMVLLTDAEVKPLDRWTWYQISPGKVRQMAERSEDGGKTWSIFWDSTYEAVK